MSTASGHLRFWDACHLESCDFLTVRLFLDSEGNWIRSRHPLPRPPAVRQTHVRCPAPAQLVPLATGSREGIGFSMKWSDRWAGHGERPGRQPRPSPLLCCVPCLGLTAQRLQWTSASICHQTTWHGRVTGSPRGPRGAQPSGQGHQISQLAESFSLDSGWGRGLEGSPGDGAQKPFLMCNWERLVSYVTFMYFILMRSGEVKFKTTP